MYTHQLFWTWFAVLLLALTAVVLVVLVSGFCRKQCRSRQDLRMRRHEIEQVQFFALVLLVDLRF
jgi:hypothetical protein